MQENRMSVLPKRSVHMTHLRDQWDMMTPEQKLVWLRKPHNVKIVINAVIPRGQIEKTAHGLFNTLNRLGEIQTTCVHHSPRKFVFADPQSFVEDIERLYRNTENVELVMTSVEALINAAQKDMRAQGWDYNYAEKFAFRQDIHFVNTTSVSTMYYT